MGLVAGERVHRVHRLALPFATVGCTLAAKTIESWRQSLRFQNWPCQGWLGRSILTALWLVLGSVAWMLPTIFRNMPGGVYLSRGAQYSTPILDTFHLLIYLLQLGQLPDPWEAKQPRRHLGLLQVSGHQVGQRHVHLRLLLEDLEVGWADCNRFTFCSSCSNHMGSEYVSREKKIDYGKFFDFCAEKCVYN